MDVEIMIHGVPQGQDYFGIEEGRSYVDLFYDNSTESVKFVVEPKATGTNAFVYYTYLRYKGIVGSGGRSGSYFGLTLRMDKYYPDVVHIYNMLEMAFKKYVVGVLLSYTGESYKYTVTSFASKKAEIEQLQQGLIQLIQGTCVWPKFVDIDAGFLHPNTTAASCNIADITESAMSTALKKYSKVVLSPDFKLNIVNEYEKKVQEAEGKGINLVSEKDKQLAEQEGVISSLNSTISTLKAKVEALQTELSQSKKNGNLTQMIATIKDPINSLADYFHVHNSEKTPPTPSYGFKNFILGIVGCILSAIIIGLCVFSLCKPPQGGGSNGEIIALTRQVDSLIAVNEKIQTEVAANTGNDTGVQGSDDQELQVMPTKNTELKIDVVQYNGSGPIYCDKTYTIKVLEKGSSKVYSGNGSWKITNATIIKGNKTDSQIEIKPNNAGLVQLSYESENCSCNARSFNAELH